jgi:F0F1-type ATP synthase assembly protein I
VSARTPTSSGDGPSQSGMVKAARFTAVGFEFGATVVAGVVLGYYIDQYVGTAPLFTLLLTLAGMGGALYRLLWTLKQISSQSNNGGRSDTNQ